MKTGGNEKEVKVLIKIVSVTGDEQVEVQIKRAIKDSGSKKFVELEK